MKRLLKIMLVLLLALSTNVHAEMNMKKCVLLPIKDNLGGSLSFKIFKNIEESLKNSSWCRYKSNSEIMNILSNYRRDLDNILEDPQVLRVIAEKLNTGSLIKVDLIKEVNSITVRLKVYSDNGEDLYFKEETQSTNDDFKVISQIINNWLEVYARQIPYDGRIIGVLGTQFSIDGGRENSLFDNGDIIILRPTRMKKHPLLKEIVEWESEKIADAKVIFSNKDQAQGKIVKYESKNKIRVNDWVLIKKTEDKLKTDLAERIPFEDEINDQYSFGKMGTVSLDLILGSTSVTTEDEGTVKKMSGTTYGIDFDVELWITRKYWASLGIMRTQATAKGREGIGSDVENSSPSSELNVLFGYKYLPMGFFNGPQVDFYGGFSQQKFSLDTISEHGITEVTFNGLALGIRGSLPLQNQFRINAELGIIFNPGFDEAANLYGEDDSASAYKIRFGGSYQYAPNITLDLNYSLNAVKASFLSPVRSISAKVSGVNLGATYTF